MKRFCAFLENMARASRETKNLSLLVFGLQLLVIVQIAVGSPANSASMDEEMEGIASKLQTLLRCHLFHLMNGPRFSKEKLLLYTRISKVGTAKTKRHFPESQTFKITNLLMS